MSQAAAPRFGSYSTVGVLGRGGMGIVYLARHPDSHLEFAIKVLSGTEASSAPLRQRFLREIRALGKLRHPGLVQVVDAGEQDGVPWFAMRRVEGTSLEERMRHGNLPPEEVIELGAQLCDALSVAHAAGILHRDLKPANVLCEGERFVVTDFGLAKDFSREATAQLSKTGVLQGTPGYWAPEQARGEGKDATAKTDVYGVGSVLYTALTGVPPFQGEGFHEVLANTLTQTPTPPSATVSVPPRLEALVMRCLEKDPDDRVSSLESLGRKLRRLQAGEEELDGAAGRRPPPLWLAAVVGGVVGVSLLVGALLSAGEPGTNGTAQPPPPLTQPPEDPDPPPAPSPLDAAPAWYRDLDPAKRPQLPLPEGVEFRLGPGEYLNVKDGSVLVWVWPGSFTMGNDAAKEMNQRPARRVTLSEGLFLGKHEVSWAQYRVFCAATGAAVPDDALDATHSAEDDHPVFSVTWINATAYCSWAGLRLPSEAEWEFAARGPKGLGWPWGQGEPNAERVNLADASATWDWPQDSKKFFGLQKADWNDGFPYTAPVDACEQGASPFGCLNMAGNVLEWVQDAYQGYDGAPSDGSAVEGIGVPLRVNRGGSWNSNVRICRPTNRGRDSPVDHYTNLGFRAARSP